MRDFELKDYEEFDTMVERNGYSHYLDYLGRTRMVEGDLRLEKGDRDLYAQRTEGGDARHEFDDGFHIIATRFGGWKGHENLVAADRLLNRGHYKRFENEWAEHLEAGRDVHVKLEPLYLENDHRPYAIVGQYTVSGKGMKEYTEYISFTNENLETEEFDLSDYDDFYPYQEGISADTVDIKD